MKKTKTDSDQNKSEPILPENEIDQRIKELEAKIAAGEEAALARVCKALGVSSSEVKSKEASAPKPEKQISLHVHYPVNVNGRVYHGNVVVAYSTFQVIMEALGKRRQRLLSELTGNNYMLKELQGGGWAPTLVGQVNDTGERIA